jgi:acetolactate synthase regulatory subunit
MDVLYWRKKKTKTVFRVLPKVEVDAILDYQVTPPNRSLVERDPARFASLEITKKLFLLKQAKMRREYEEKGYCMSEVEVTDDEEDAADARVERRCSSCKAVTENKMQLYKVYDEESCNTQAASIKKLI